MGFNLITINLETLKQAFFLAYIKKPMLKVITIEIEIMSLLYYNLFFRILIFSVTNSVLDKELRKTFIILITFLAWFSMLYVGQHLEYYIFINEYCSMPMYYIFKLSLNMQEVS